jgi:hypothetical protein
VCTELVDETVAALAVAESHEALGEQLDPDGCAVVLGKFLGEERWQPVLAEQLAHRRARAGACQQLVELRLQHRGWSSRLLCHPPYVLIIIPLAFQSKPSLPAGDVAAGPRAAAAHGTPSVGATRDDVHDQGAWRCGRDAAAVVEW